MSEQIEVVQNTAKNRFEITVDGAMVGLADYMDDDGVRAFPHTEVDPSQQGKGLAGKLVGFALASTREAGLKVDPICPYVAGFMNRHPQYKELLV